MAVRSKNHCIYCGQFADTKDHVPLKCLFEKPYPPNLLTVPSCQLCNQSFSKDEEYFINILSEIATNRTLRQKLEVGGSIYNARIRRPKLGERIDRSKTEGENKIIYITPEFERLALIVEKISRGLYMIKYKKGSPVHTFNCIGIYPFNIEDQRPADIFLLTYSEKFKSKRWNIIQRGVFSYIVVRDWRRENRLSMIMNFHDTVWAVVAIPFPSNNKFFKEGILKLI